MSEVNFTWFRVQYLKDAGDDFEEIVINFCALISFLSTVEIDKLLKITKVDIKFGD